MALEMNKVECWAFGVFALLALIGACGTIDYYFKAHEILKIRETYVECYKQNDIQHTGANTQNSHNNKKKISQY